VGHRGHGPLRPVRGGAARWADAAGIIAVVFRLLLRVALLTSLPIALLMALAAPVLAASPSPSGDVGGDPRSPGQGPGLVGDPATAVLLVIAIGLVAVAVTLLYVKATGGRRS
jgi:hypothetical protein